MYSYSWSFFVFFVSFVVRAGISFVMRISIRSRETMPKETHILVVDGEPRICEFLEVLLARCGYKTDSAHYADEALARITVGAYDLALADLAAPLNGAEDYVTKPFNIDELRTVVSRALQPVPAVR